MSDFPEHCGRVYLIHMLTVEYFDLSVMCCQPISLAAHYSYEYCPLTPVIFSSSGAVEDFESET